MPRSRKSVAILCIAIVVFAAFLTAASIHLSANLTPLWPVLPALSVMLICRRAVGCDEQSLSLLWLGAARAPPATRALA
jgi:hypothetical protein